MSVQDEKERKILLRLSQDISAKLDEIGDNEISINEKDFKAIRQLLCDADVVVTEILKSKDH